MADIVAPPFKNWRTTLERLEKFLSDAFFVNYNLTSQLYKDVKNISQVPCLKYQTGRPLFKNVEHEKFESVELTSTSFGPTWSTYWFKLDIDLPSLKSSSGATLDNGNRDLVPGLLWKCDCEAMVYDQNGVPLQSFSEERTFFRLPDQNLVGTYYIELACNGMFGAGEHCIQPTNLEKTFRVTEAKIVLRNEVAFELYHKMQMIHDAAKELGKDNISASNALFTANHCENFLHRRGFTAESIKEALSIINNLFPLNTEPRNSPEHLTIDAFGHCHIDTAWLWPYNETKRKCARSWANQVALMSKHKNFKFVCSQAQQFKWVETDYPDLFKNILEYVQKGQFVPIGGCWVEMDGNVPSCVSFCQQFLYGQKYFKEKFGMFSDVFWLPDTFGYSTLLPQIANLSGIKYFLTQKLSWNLVNTFPHNSFIWEGIDGSQLLTHFPPNDNYCARLNPSELMFAEKNFKDKGRSQEAMMLFGFGDGGGGPTDEMLIRLNALQTEHKFSMPSCITSTPTQFFQRLENCRPNLCKWVGELYFELHQGTFTTHSEIKRLNNRMENLLRAAEFYLAVLSIYSANNPQSLDLNQLDLTRMRSCLKQAWELVLCNQFHDVLPGSCIEEVAKDAIQYYREAEDLLKFSFLCQHEKNDKDLIEASSETSLLSGKVDLNQWSIESCSKQTDLSYNVAPSVSSTSENCSFLCLKNELIEVNFTLSGTIKSLLLSGQDEAIELCGNNPLNVFKIYSDMPLFWDAWDIMDYHAETGVCVIAKSHKVDPQSLQFFFDVGDKSSLEMRVFLSKSSPNLEFQLKVDWHEAHKLLKVEFPFNLRPSCCYYGSQIGYVERTNTMNTSQDTAKFEVCGHKWAAMQQYGVGCAVLTPAKYGFRALESTLSLSLLRSPKSPDANADMGQHIINYALMPYHGTFQTAGVQKRADQFNLKFDPFYVQIQNRQWLEQLVASAGSLISISAPAVRIESFQCAFDQNNVFVLKLSEQFGSAVSCTVKLNTGLCLKSYLLCDILERPLPGQDWEMVPTSGVELTFKPFKLICLLLKL